MGSNMKLNKTYVHLRIDVHGPHNISELDHSNKLASCCKFLVCPLAVLFWWHDWENENPSSEI